MPKANGKTSAGERIRLLQMRAENVKLIREVEINFEGDITEIRGDSGQGKTTILESVEGGLRSLDPDMIRKGESAASIELRLSNATIRRVVRRDGTESLMVSDDSGKPIDKAKDFLRTICSPSAFRPIEWVRLGGGEAKGRTERLRRQRDQLLEAIPMILTAEDIAKAVNELGDEYADALADVNLDRVNFDQHALSVCSAIEAACYDYRKSENAKVEAVEASLAATPAPERPAPKCSLAECEAAEEAARKAYYAADGRVSGYEELAKRRDALKAQIAAEEPEMPKRADLQKTFVEYETRWRNATAEIKRLEALMEAQRALVKEAEEKLAKCDDLGRRLARHEARIADLEALEVELADAGTEDDIDELKAQLEAAQEATRARRMQDAHDKAVAAAERARYRAELYDGLVRLFRDTLPKRLIAQADLPVEGLGVDADQILINGIPLHQLGTSQQIRVGVIIAAALNPRSAFVLVDGAESMGRSDRKALAEVAKELGLQLIMTIVDPDAEPSDGVTVMRDGVALSA